MEFSLSTEMSYSGSGLPCPTHNQPPIKLEEQIRHLKQFSYSLQRTDTGYRNYSIRAVYDEWVTWVRGMSSGRTMPPTASSHVCRVNCTPAMLPLSSSNGFPTDKRMLIRFSVSRTFFSFNVRTLFWKGANLSYKQTRPNSRGENGNWETTSFTPKNNENLACPLFYHRNFKNGKLRSTLGRLLFL